MAAVCPATDAGPHFLQSIGSTDLKCKAFRLVKEEKKKIFRPVVIRRIHPEWKLSSERKGRGGKNYKKLFLLNKPNGWDVRSARLLRTRPLLSRSSFFFLYFVKKNSLFRRDADDRKEQPRRRRNMEKIIITTIARSLGPTLFFHPECFRLPFSSFYWRNYFRSFFHRVSVKSNFGEWWNLKFFILI